MKKKLCLLISALILFSVVPIFATETIQNVKAQAIATQNMEVILEEAGETKETGHSHLEIDENLSAGTGSAKHSFKTNKNDKGFYRVYFLNNGSSSVIFRTPNGSEYPIAPGKDKTIWSLKATTSNHTTNLSTVDGSRLICTFRVRLGEHLSNVEIKQ